MVRLSRVLVLGIVGVAGCAAFRDTFTSHSETAARVGSRELKSAAVAEIITRLGGPNASPEAASAITGIWVDYQLFAEHIAKTRADGDTALMNRLIWPQVAQFKISAWHDSLLASRGQLSEASIDSAYSAQGFRLFQHILVRPTGAAAADTAKAKAEAQRLAQQARSGDFGKLAKQYSADPANKDDGGFLPVSPRGTFVPEFEAAGWELNPGEVSGVVQTPFGWHVIRRPALAEVRGRFEPAVRQRSTALADSIFIAQLLASSKIELKSGAPETVRKATKDMASASRSSKLVATYAGGDLRVSDLSRWLASYPTQTLNQIQEAPDSLVENLVKFVIQNELLLKQADSAKVAVTGEMRANLINQIQSQILEVRAASGLDAPELADSAKTPSADRQRIAGEKIDDYFKRLTTNQAQFRPVPPTLSAELRATGDYRIYDAGIAKAMELVSAAQKKDSAAPQPPQAPGLQPAPGGPPVGGQNPAPPATPPAAPKP